MLANIHRMLAGFHVFFQALARLAIMSFHNFSLDILRRSHLGSNNSPASASASASKHTQNAVQLPRTLSGAVPAWTHVSSSSWRGAQRGPPKMLAYSSSPPARVDEQSENISGISVKLKSDVVLQL